MTGSAGSLVFWQVVPEGALAFVAAWRVAGLPERPVSLLAVEAFDRAFAGMVENRHFLVHAGGPLEREIVLKERDAYVPVLRVVLRPRMPANLKATTISETLVYRLAFYERSASHRNVDGLSKRIESAYVQEVERLGASQIADMAASAAVVVARAVPLSAGTHFVPLPRLDEWQRFARAMSETGGVAFQEMRVERSSQTDAVVVGAVLRCLKSAVDRIESLAKEKGSEGVEGQPTRWPNNPFESKGSKGEGFSSAAEVEEQLGMYEELFADNSDVRDAVSRLRARLATVLLKENERVDTGLWAGI